MADSSAKPDSQKSSVVFIKDVSHWELNGKEYVYPVTVEQKGVDWRVFFALSAHTNQEFKRVLEQARTPRKVVGGEIEPGLENRQPYRDFVDEHFIRLYGSPDEDPKHHKAWLDAKPGVKERIFREGVHSVAPVLDESEDGFSLDIGETEVKLVQNLYCPKVKREVEIRMIHRFRQETVIDLHKFEKANGSRLNLKRREMRDVIHYDSLDQLYNGMVQSVSGYLVDGKKPEGEEWKQLVPLAHKLRALGVVFESAQAKNV
jgi:hypothetical protein